MGRASNPSPSIHAKRRRYVLRTRCPLYTLVTPLKLLNNSGVNRHILLIKKYIISKRIGREEWAYSKSNNSLLNKLTFFLQQIDIFYTKVISNLLLLCTTFYVHSFLATSIAISVKENFLLPILLWMERRDFNRFRYLKYFLKVSLGKRKFNLWTFTWKKRIVSMTTI